MVLTMMRLRKIKVGLGIVKSLQGFINLNIDFCQWVILKKVDVKVLCYTQKYYGCPEMNRFFWVEDMLIVVWIGHVGSEDSLDV